MAQESFFCRNEDADEAREDLAFMLNAALKKSSPTGFSGSTKTAQAARKQQVVPMFLLFHRLVVQSDVFEVRKTKKFGNGVFALRDVTFDEVQQALPGNHDNLVANSDLGFRFSCTCEW